jgi:hypothetical protein
MNFFGAPIPGQSLTAEPRNYPWENPMMTADPEKAIQAHIDRISRPETMDAIVTMLELGMSVRAMTESILTNATMNGIHDTDVSILIAPVIHEQIKKIAEYAGVDAEEGFGEDKGTVETREKELLKARVRKELNKNKELPPETEEMMTETLQAMEQPMQQEAAPMEEPAKQGLMARRTM